MSEKSPIRNCMNSFQPARLLFYFFIAGTFLVSCKARKSALPSEADVKPMKDRSVEDLLSRIDSSAFKAEWLNAKASVSTREGDNETRFTIHLRGKKDSVLWISISPLLGIEVARVLITTDSIKVLDRLNSKYRVSSMDYINRLLQLKVNFEIVQSLLTGNFFAYRKNENKFNSVYIEDKYYILSSLTKHKLKRSLEEKDLNKPVIQDCYVDSTYRITKMSVEDQKIDKVLVAEYDDFRLTDGGLFPYKMKTVISAEKNFEIEIDYARVEVSEKQEFPFTIPDSYERLQ